MKQSRTDSFMEAVTNTTIGLADRRVLIAENGELRAANANPCPAH